MKFGRRLVLASAVLSVLAGSLADRLRAQSAASTFVYVTNRGANSVSAYAVDDSTGMLTEVQGSPFATGIQPAGVAVDRSNRFLYVANNYFGSAGNLSAYAIDGTTGALTPLQGSPFQTAIELPHGLATEPSGRFLYVTNYSGSTEVFAIDATTGALTAIAGSPFSGTSGSYTFPSVDPSGRFLFDTAFGDWPEAPGVVFVSSIDPASGALTLAPVSPFPTGGGETIAVGTDTSSRFVYAGNKLSSDISAFTLDVTSGGLTPVTGSPFPATSSPSSISAHPSGRFLFVSNVGSFHNNIAAFTIDGATGALTLVGSPTPVPGYLWQGTLDPSGRFYFAVNSVYPNIRHSISAFTVDGTAGALTEAPGSPFNTGTDPYSLAVAQVARP